MYPSLLPISDQHLTITTRSPEVVRLASCSMQTGVVCSFCSRDTHVLYLARSCDCSFRVILEIACASSTNVADAYQLSYRNHIVRSVSSYSSPQLPLPNSISSSLFAHDFRREVAEGSFIRFRAV